MLYEVIPTRLFRHNSSTLTYSSEIPLQPGHIVLIPFGRTSIPGIVFRQSTIKNPDFSVKSISKLLYKTPLPHHLLSATTWLSEYYLTPLPTVANLLLPAGITKTRRRKKDQKNNGAVKQCPPSSTISSDYIPNIPLSTTIPLNSAQRRALTDLTAASSTTRLLHGVTGSGKTNIYLTLAAKTISQNQSVILLVPEISLTPQLVSIFEQTFPGQTTLIHSRQTEAERHLTWEEILLAKTPDIVIGPRSALFAPLKNLGLIIIDEAHEPSYFQESPPKYSALRLASYIASQSQSQSQSRPQPQSRVSQPHQHTRPVTCLFGTATPLISDYYLAQRNHALVPLTSKAKATASTPDIHIIDLKNTSLFTKNRYFSNPLLSQISDNLVHHHQTLIFHNRRGSSSLTICEKCGWQALCPTCFLPLTLHTDAYKLICHTCGSHTQVPTKCPSCGHLGIIHKGFGTKMLESELKKLFPKAKIARFDADNTKATSLDAQYQTVKSGETDIIIGTQTIARGLDLPHLATVGIAQADAGLSLPDYAAEERTFHLLTQVIGRVGRGHLNTASAFIQTYQPDHPIIVSACKTDYETFYRYLLSKRHKSHLPPYRFLAKLSITYKTETTTIKYIRQFHRQLSNRPHLHLSTPTPAFHERTSSGFTWQIILSASSRQCIIDAIRTLPPNPHMHFILDPPSLLS